MKNIAYVVSGLLIGLIVLFLFFTFPAKGENTATPVITSNTEKSNTPTFSASQIKNCTSVREVNFCAKGVALTKDYTYVMLEIKTSANTQPDGMGFMLSSFGESTSLPRLQDDLNNENSIVDSDQSLMTFSGIDSQTFLQTLKFPPLNQNAKSATLKFSFVGIYTPLQLNIQLNLGEKPQAGQTISLDQTINLQGQVIHLSKAELSSGDSNSLLVDIWSDPVNLKNNAISIAPKLGMPEGIDMGTGFGSKWILSGSPFHAIGNLPLTRNTPMSGLINIPIEGLSAYYQGDFKISFTIPDDHIDSQITPTPEQLAHITEIRRFAGNEELKPIFVTFENTNDIWSAMYLTNDYSKYWVETQTGRVTQFELGEMLENKNSDLKSKNDDELRSVAEQFATANSIKFSQLRNKLLLSEKLEGNLHLFLWEYKEMVIPDVNAPFLQVVVSPDGKVVRYTNTLDFVGQ